VDWISERRADGRVLEKEGPAIPSTGCETSKSRPGHGEGGMGFPVLFQPAM
jgi:hypothetical protein